MTIADTDQCVLAGVRATGRLHLGNYLGSLKSFVSLANKQHVRAYLFVADIHTLSSSPDPAKLRQAVIELVMDLLACGVDSDRVTIFAQSSVAETAELAWLLATMTYATDLERMPAFRERERERAGSATEPLNAGVLNYPVLMAADILGLGATHVAVGEDQYPHLELARDIARRFNKRYPPALFAEPQPLALSPTRIPGLDGAGKMGKSQHNTLPLFESSEARWSKLQSAATDPGRKSMLDRGTPERCPIYAMHHRMTAESVTAEIASDCRSAKLSCVDCKRKLHASLETELGPLRERREQLAKTPDVAIEQLREGAKKVRATVGAVRDAIHSRVGIVRY